MLSRLKNLIANEPVLFATLVKTLLGLAVSLGLKLDSEKMAAVIATFNVVGALFARSQVTPVSSGPKPPSAGVAVGLIALLALAISCSPAAQLQAAKPQVARVADVVDEIAKRGDQVYAVAVDACHTTEKALALTAPPEDAGRLVDAVRARCHAAFDALELQRQAIARVDGIMAQFERGEVPLARVLNAAMDARDAWNMADKAQRDLGAYLARPQ